MNRQIYKDALSSVIIASDLQDFLETGNSFIIDSLIQLGMEEPAAQEFLLTKGGEELRIAQTYMDCFGEFGEAADFEEFISLDETIEAGKQGIITSLTMGMTGSNPQLWH